MSDHYECTCPDCCEHMDMVRKSADVGHSNDPYDDPTSGARDGNDPALVRGDCRWLLGAFAHYAIHDTPCDFAKNEMRPCSCGLDEIMAAVLTEIEAEDDATESAT